MTNDFKQIESVAPAIEIQQGPTILIPKKNVIFTIITTSCMVLTECVISTNMMMYSTEGQIISAILL